MAVEKERERERERESKKTACFFIALVIIITSFVSQTCHDFAWSRTLWADSAKRMAWNTLYATIVYLALGFYFMSYLNGDRGIGKSFDSNMNLSVLHEGAPFFFTRFF